MSTKLEVDVNSEEWRTWFLTKVGEHLHAAKWSRENTVSAKVNGKMAQQKLGLPRRLWEEISSEYWLLVEDDRQGAHRFLAGVAIGWREATRMRSGAAESARNLGTRSDSG